jgi:hypothetical protein
VLAWGQKARVALVEVAQMREALPELGPSHWRGA